MIGGGGRSLLPEILDQNDRVGAKLVWHFSPNERQMESLWVCVSIDAAAAAAAFDDNESDNADDNANPVDSEGADKPSVCLIRRFLTQVPCCRPQRLLQIWLVSVRPLIRLA